MSLNDDKDDFDRMQHLINEMDRSNQRIDLFSEKFEMDGASHGTALKRPSPNEKQFNVLLDDACRSEESDGTGAQDSPARGLPKNGNDSGCDDVINSAIAEVSKDFLLGLQTSGTQKLYDDSDESRISSDTDFKSVGGMPAYARYPESAAGLSDTDWNPYGTESDNNQSPHLQTMMKESKSSTISPFQPIFNSTRVNVNTSSSGDKVMSVTSDSQLSDIKEVSERVLSDVEPKSKASQFSRVVGKPDWAITPLKARSEVNALREASLVRPDKLPTDRRESTSSDEEKKLIASTSSTGYSSAASGGKINVERSTAKVSGDHAGTKHMSVFERAKQLGIPDDILFDRPAKGHVGEKTQNDRGGLSDYESDDLLGQRVSSILSHTAHLGHGDDRMRYNHGKTNIDYGLLQKDLQDIQDNLESLSSNSSGGDHVGGWSKGRDNKSPLSSDRDGDTPSVSSTPDRNRNNPVWDFSEAIGSLANGIDTDGAYSRRSRTKKMTLNSDGDETRSSDSSHKSEDHVGHSERPDGFQPSVRELQTSHDVDHMLSTFKDQRHQLESRYEQLSNHGLAEKVFRILTNQDPELQADGILSEVSADEKEMKTKLAMRKPYTDFDFSSNSSLMEESQRNFGFSDDVRKKLDLSGLSSVDSSRALDRSSFNVPASSKGFSVFDDAKRLLSSQMEKASERTFNHSIEMRYPQTIQCYPLFMDSNSDSTGGKNQDQQRESGSPEAGAIEETVTGASREDLHTSATPPLEDRPAGSSPQESLAEKEQRGSPTSSDPGSTSRPKEKYRPYRPPGSKDVYYTESDTASVADSVTTMESTHFGSDDAAGPPHLPQSAYGSRKDAPNVAGIYGNRKNLSTVQESTEPSTVEETSLKQEDRGPKPAPASGEAIPARPRVHQIVPQPDRNSGRSAQAATTQRYSTSIWAKRDELAERKEEKPKERIDSELPSRVDPGSPSHSVSAARRNAQWANREEERQRASPDMLSRINAGRDELFEPISSQRPSRLPTQDFVEAIGDDSRGNVPREDFSLPTNAFMREQGEEEEPMSLRIKLSYEDDPPKRGHLQSDNRSNNKYNDRLKPHFTEEDLDFNVRISRSPERYAHNRSLIRSLSDENLNLSSQREPRLSPAFRRALSPELLNSIGSRSPLLSRTIERSLAQPPSDYPAYGGNDRSSSPTSRRLYGLNDPPTFLARDRPRQHISSPLRERSFSPRLRVASPPMERSYPVRERASSPPRDRPYLDRERTTSPPRDRPYLDRERTSPPRERFHPMREHVRSPVFERRGGRLSPSRAANASSPSRDLLSLQDDLRSRVQQSTLIRRQIGDEENGKDGYPPYGQPSSSSLPKRNRKVELTLENMSSESEADTEIDREPVSRRAQLLTEALSHEREPGVNPDINAMWEQFKAYNESDDSSVNTSRMEAVADLLKSPSTHLVSQYLKEREEYRIERQERVEREREKRISEKVRVAHKSSSSEDDFSERYRHELLVAKEEERMRRRSAKKKKGKNGATTRTPEGNRGEKKSNAKCTENLYSIPEYRSSEQSTSKTPSASKSAKSHAHSQPNVIDPGMLKLREKISNQRKKVDSDMMKKMSKIDRLNKLEQLLKAKRQGQITDQMLQQQLEELSSSASYTLSDQSQENSKSMEPSNSALLSDDGSTTVKDSSGEMQMWKMRKESWLKDLESNYKEQDRLRVKNYNNNKENKPRTNPTRIPKDASQRQSELKLLKLVRDGYLTADEAYTVALARTGRGESQIPEDVSVLSSENDSSFNGGRPHKFYSPYSRSPPSISHIKHVPKLKYSDRFTDTHSSTHKSDRHRAREDKNGFDESKSESQPSQHFKHPMRGGTRKMDTAALFTTSTFKRERGRPRSQSPLGASRQRQGGQRKVTLSGHHSPARAHSSSPSRWSKGNRGQHQSRRKNTAAEALKKEFSPAVTWNIDIDTPPSQWKEPQPLQEIAPSSLNQLFDNERHHHPTKERDIDEQTIWRKSHHPAGIPKLEWEDVVSRDVLASKTNHWQVDPVMDRVQYILNKPSDQSSFTSGGRDGKCSKSLSRLSLQDAFLHRKPDFVSHCRERQKRLNFAKEDRHMQEHLRLEREAIFAEQQRLGPANIYAHPYSDNLYQPKRRVLTKHEMKQMTAKKYKKLPEVVEKTEEDRKKIQYTLNRLRANLFNKKVQKEILKKNCKQRRR